MLELEHVGKLYRSPGAEIRAVDGVSLTLAAGEMVALYGPSGSGKTTLLLLAGGLLTCDSGRARFDGEDLALLSKRDMREHRRRRLGFVFQSFNLIPGLSAEENVALPLLLRGARRKGAFARARAALAEVGLAARARHLPAELSGGEQQRTSIARALVGEPRLILGDEPTGNLDSVAGEALLELLGGLPRERGVAMLLATHDAHVASYADRVLELRDGRLAEPNLRAASAIRV